MCAQRLSASMRLAHSAMYQILNTGRCSTPFGIYEVGTDLSNIQPTAATGAQRLSASMRLAPGTQATGTSASLGCSTPFGIYEVGTSNPLSPMIDSRGAQRLSASMRLARTADEFWQCLVACSTPFGIYEVGTLVVAAGSLY